MAAVSVVIGVFLVLQAFVEITLPQFVQTIYDRTPKLRIRGAGFDADEHDISIDISANGEEPLRMDKDFVLSKSEDNDGIVLKLLFSRKLKFKIYSLPLKFLSGGSTYQQELLLLV
jgi:hypothetical protein